MDTTDTLNIIDASSEVVATQAVPDYKSAVLAKLPRALVISKPVQVGQAEDGSPILETKYTAYKGQQDHNSEEEAWKDIFEQLEHVRKTQHNELLVQFALAVLPEVVRDAQVSATQVAGIAFDIATECVAHFLARKI